MALRNGQTPEEIAKEVIDDATKSRLVEIQGTTFQKLETVVRYLTRDKIQARGENWFVKNHDALLTDTLDILIGSREKAIVDYLAKKEQNEKDEAFRELISKGITVTDAYKAVYSN